GPFCNPEGEPRNPDIDSPPMSAGCARGAGRRAAPTSTHLRTETKTPLAREGLFCGLNFCLICSAGFAIFYWRQRLGCKEVVIVEIAVHVTCNLRGLRTKCRASAFKENHHNHAASIRVCIAGEPAKACPGMGAGARLSQNFFFF